MKPVYFLNSEYRQEYFTLYAIIFVCIHDAPGGFTLSRQTKGKSGVCPICIDEIASVYLPSSRKLVYMRHRRFLPRKYKYRKMKMHFDNIVEKDSAPKQYTRKLVLEMVKNIKVVFGKGTETYLLRSNQFFHVPFVLKVPSNLSQH
jgi:hypothetical protein